MKIDVSRRHRPWLALLAAGLVLLAAGRPLAEWGLERAQSRAADLAAQAVRMQETERQFQDDLHMAGTSDGRMNAEDVDHLLAPVDRLRVAAGLERQAASAGLTHFTYALAPGKKARVDIVDADDMIESGLTIDADAPLDIDAAAFIRHLNFALPGRVHLSRLTLTRGADDASLALSNLHLSAELQWLSNGEGMP